MEMFFLGELHIWPLMFTKSFNLISNDSNISICVLEIYSFTTPLVMISRFGLYCD